MMFAAGKIDPAGVLLKMDGHAYPRDYRRLRLRGYRAVPPWRCIDDVDEASTLRKEFLLEVGRGSIPVLDILPFARRESSDDFAGFVQSQGIVTGEVCVIHLTFRASAEVADYPRHQRYASIWEWVRMAIAE